MLLRLIIIFQMFFVFTFNAFAFQNEPDNFRGIKWGTQYKDLTNFILSEKDGDNKYYHKKEDKLSIGDAKLDSISYGFYQNKFYAVTIIFTGENNFSNLKETLIQTYGEGYQDNPYLDNYRWGSTDDNLLIGFKYNTISKKGSLVYIYTSIMKEMVEASKNKAKEGAKDL